MSALKPDLICFSHLRWDFVFQRPQHLLKRCAKEHRVFFFEEPIFDNGSMHLHVSEREQNLNVVVPYLPQGLQSEVARIAVLQEMVQRLLSENGINDYLTWYYTPMAIEFTRHLKPRVVIYDCMDELSAFRGAPECLTLRERELFALADLVFTGGHSLFEAKRNQHASVFAFPSSIDREHFVQARNLLPEPEDQMSLKRPRLGFFGVIDERFDVQLLDDMARTRPEWQFVIIGPVVKIDPDILPQRPNIHYLGAKSYQDLPAYIAGWDVALLLFAQNESTRFISPTKTPEYLAAGKPVVSTPIQDVIYPYGQLGLVRVAYSAREFIAAIDDLLQTPANNSEWLRAVDKFLAKNSWDKTWARMSRLIDEKLATKIRAGAVLETAGQSSQGVAA